MNLFQVAAAVYRNWDRLKRTYVLIKPLIEYFDKYGDELGKNVRQLEENFGLKPAPAKSGDVISARYDVEWIQRTLNKDLGLDLDVDGDYGIATKQAVQTFQKKHHLEPVDGWVGPLTAEKMESLPQGG
jgi:peptidoglycan hydrolase-like protein with peptidoglycan-binding domain